MNHFTPTDILLLIEDYQGSYTKILDQQASSLKELSYEDCAKIAFSKRIYYSDAYIKNMEMAGWKASQVIPGCKPMQYKWAQEKGMKTPPEWASNRPFRWYWTKRLQVDPVSWTLDQILLSQIDTLQPELVWAFSGVKCLAKPEMLSEIRNRVKNLVLWWACPLSSEIPYNQFDLILSGIPTLVRYFQLQGLKAAHMPHAFDERILQQVPAKTERIPKVAFVGTLSLHHLDRVMFLDALSRQVEVDFYGTGSELLPYDSPLRKNARPPLWGEELYEVYGSYLIAFHKNIGVAGQSLSAKRIFEATGMGACLVTEKPSNEKEPLFEPEREIVTYSSLEECIEKIQYLLDHPEKAQEIGKLGQEKTLKAHTYKQRVEQLNSHFQELGLTPSLAVNQ